MATTGRRSSGNGATGHRGGASQTTSSHAAPPAPANEVTADWYASNYGSDAMDGRSPMRPLQTIARLIVLYDGTGTIYLDRGSVWREQIIDLPTGTVIRAYGTGARPIIDARETIATNSWSSVGSNTYVTTVVHNFGPDAAAGQNVKHRIWEDDQMLNRAASLAACKATAGTFWADTPTIGGSDPVYVHATGGGNPASNGKAYKATTREWCVYLRDHRDHAHIWGLEGIGNAHGAGPLVIDGGIHNCVSRDGQTHNIYVRGICEDTNMPGLEPGDAYGSTTSLVVHADLSLSPWNQGRNGIVRRCRALPGSTMVGPLGGSNKDFNVGFFCHFDGGLEWGDLYFEDCYVEESALGWGGHELQNFTTYRCSTGPNVTRAYEPYAGNVSGTGALVVLGGTYLTTGPNNQVVGFTSDFGAPKTIIVRGAKSHRIGGANGPFSINISVATVSITRCTLSLNASGGSANVFTRGAYAFTENIVSGPTDVLMLALGADGIPIPSLAADRNVYWNAATPTQAVFTRGIPSGGTDTYFTLAAWRAASGQDTNSLNRDPLLADPANGDFTIGDPTTLALAGAYIDEEDDAVLQALLATWGLTDADL